MMRREDAEKLTGKEINIETKNWKSYVPIFNVPGLSPLVLNDNPVIAIHPGYKHYEDDKKTQRYMKKFSGYEKYLKRLKTKLKEADSEGRTIIVYSPTEYLEQTLQTVGPLKNLVLVPNKGRVSIDSETLGMTEDELYNHFSQHFRHAKLLGEWNEGCVEEFESTAGRYIILERDYDCIFPSDEQLGEWKCKSPVDEFLTVPQSDYLVRIADEDEFRVKLRQGQKKLRRQLTKEFNVKENTCFAALLDHMVERSGIDSDVGDSIPYSSVYELKGMEKWSEPTIRKNLNKMERLGIIYIRDADEITKKIYRVITEASKKLGINFQVRKLVIPRRTLKSSELGIDEDKLGTASPKDVIRSISAEELEDMEKSGYTIVEKADIRSMNDSGKTETVLSMYKNWRKDLGEEKKKILTLEEKAELIDQASSKLKEYPHVREVHIAGSFARNKENDGSDIDLLLVRESCPGMRNCVYNFKKGPMDVFCFTENEMNELKERKAVITSALSRLK